jgi:flagellin-like hook-associated protein FlgL
MSNDVVLTAALRSNLNSLQKTQSLIDETQFKLATGRKVNSALDNPQNFFSAQSLNNRAGDLSRLLDGIGQSIQTLKQADAGITSLTKLVEQADAVVENAREAINKGGTQAKIVGNANLRGIDDLGATVPGITDTDELIIQITDPKNPGTLIDFDTSGASDTTANITIADGDGIDDLLNKLNGLRADTDTGDVPILEAKLNDKGQLEIKTLNGGDLNINFNAADNTDATNLAFASALGFGGQARAVGENAAANNQVEITASASSKIKSFKLYNNTADRVASRSDALTGLVNGDDKTVTLFAALDNAADEFEIAINGGSSQTVELSGATIQSFIDSINNNDALKTQIKAGYNDATGEIEIERLSDSVQDITIGLESNTATDDANFGFGTRTFDNILNGQTNSFEEVIRFGSAAAELEDYENDFNNIRTQIDQLVTDAGYRGVNLLKGDDLETNFNADRTSKLKTEGVTFTAEGLGIKEADFSSETTIVGSVSAIRDALTKVRSFGSSIANDLSIIQTRQDFTKNTISNLQEGADKLTIADQNEEGARLLSLQTRQQLGVTSLSLASQSQQAVLRLF